MSTAYPLLYHYADTPIHSVGTVSPRWADERLHSHPKPFGFWVSDDSDYGWAEWCSDEGFGPRVEYRYIVLLHAPQRLLWLTHEGAVRGFIEEFAVVPEWARRFSRSRLPDNEQDYWRQPDWERVCERWAGIVITPYQWPLRMEPGFMWYYGWDCASGVIWDGSVVSGLMPAPAIQDHHWGPRRLPRAVA